MRSQEKYNRNINHTKAPFTQNASLPLKTQDTAFRNVLKKITSPCCHQVKQFPCQLSTLDPTPGISDWHLINMALMCKMLQDASAMVIHIRLACVYMEK